MEKNTKISIIVPVYNSEKYVAKSIESLLKQTLKEIEIILVDDGSKDTSGAICDEYAAKDERILVVHKVNGGLADARNAGMKVVEGKYIMFLDADDMYEPDTCENMYKVAEENAVDYASANYIMIDDNDVKRPKPAFDTEKYGEFELKLSDYTISFFVMNSTAWNKIYRTQFLIDNDITFKVPSPSEDDYFTSLCYIKASRGFYTPNVMYLYRNVPNSLSKKWSLKYFKGINYAYKTIYESFNSNDEINYYRYVYAKKNAYLLCQLIDSEEVNHDEKIECLKDFEWYFDLSDELKVNIVHESLKKAMELVKSKDYANAIIEMDKLKEYRKGIPDDIKKRMSFPTQENYAEMAKYDEQF